MRELHSHLAFRVARDGYRLRLNPSYFWCDVSGGLLYRGMRLRVHWVMGARPRFPSAEPGASVHSPTAQSAGTVRSRAQSRSACTCSPISTDSGRVLRISCITSSVSSGFCSA